MSRLVALVGVLLLSGGLVRAEEGASRVVPAEPVPLVAAQSAAGGCQLPDLAGLPLEEATARAVAAGFEVVEPQAALAACPVRFSCSSISACATGMLCSIANIGRCCSTGGLGLCCVQGSIWVTTCPCRCTGTLCAVACTQSSNVSWTCA